MSDYDAPSHTFVRREVAALRALGLTVIPFSVQKADHVINGAQSLLGRSPLAYLGALLWVIGARPGGVARGWLHSLRHRPPGVRALLWSQFHFIEAVLLARLLQQERCERLHSHFANSGATVAMLAAHMLGISWSLTLHGISETDYPAGMLLAEKIKRAQWVACASYFMRAQAMRLVDPVHWSKMRVIRCGLDLSRLPTTKTEENEGALRVVCVGRLSPEKGYFGLLEALDLVAKRGLDFHLTVVGDGPAAVAIRAHARCLGLAERIDFMGFLPENQTLDQIARADVFVLPSFMEGLPVVLMEALALGKPAVASRVAGIPELVVEEKTGLLFTPSDWLELSEKVERLLTDPTLRRRLGEEGRKAVLAEFQIECAAQRLRDLFLVE